MFTVGAGSLGAEIAAARLLAPWFGASTIVWANTIAVVLVALSVGYALGGRFADRDPRPAGLARIVLIAAALLAVVPFVSGPFLHQAVRAVDQLSAATFVGSLLGVGALIALPLVLLGMVAPYAVRLEVDQVAESGRTAGRLYAISTVGSLVGTFLAALLLIPVVGTRRTFLTFAAVMALAALPHLTRGRLTAAVVPVTILGLIALPTGTIKAAEGANRVIWEKQTEYQYARVVQAPDGERTLELNEGHAVHSMYRPGRWLTGNYWDEMLVLALAGASSPPSSVAILGDAAGTTARALGHYFPTTRVDAVEIDGALTQVGRELFDLHGPRLHTHTADARPWLRASGRRFDVIMVDAYRQPYIPFYLTTREFFALVRDHLAPGGLVVINVGHPAQSDQLEKVLSATMRADFGTAGVWRDPAEPTNTMLVGTTAPDPADRLRGDGGTAARRPRRGRSCDGRPARSGTPRRTGVHRRPCPGRVAGRHLPGRGRRVAHLPRGHGARTQSRPWKRTISRPPTTCGGPGRCWQTPIACPRARPPSWIATSTCSLSPGRLLGADAAHRRRPGGPVGPGRRLGARRDHAAPRRARRRAGLGELRRGVALDPRRSPGFLAWYSRDGWDTNTTGMFDGVSRCSRRCSAPTRGWSSGLAPAGTDSSCSRRPAASRRRGPGRDPQPAPRPDPPADARRPGSASGGLLGGPTLLVRWARVTAPPAAVRARRCWPRRASCASRRPTRCSPRRC